MGKRLDELNMHVTCDGHDQPGEETDARYEVLLREVQQRMQLDCSLGGAKWQLKLNRPGNRGGRLV